MTDKDILFLRCMEQIMHKTTNLLQENSIANDNITLSQYNDGSNTSNKNPLTNEEQLLLQSNIPYFLDLAKMHNLTSCFYHSLYCFGIELANPYQEQTRQFVLSQSYHVYRMIAFTKRVVTILEEEHITYALLKGISLLSCYPIFECRSFGDVDILVPDHDDYKRLLTIFKQRGFSLEEHFAEHHVEMTIMEDGDNYLLEVHHKVIARQTNSSFNNKVKHLFHQPQIITRTFAPAQITYHALDTNENAIYLLLHMLQHFLSSGFGIRLLMDWSLFLQENGNRLNLSQFQSELEYLGITGFCNAMTQICIEFLNLEMSHAKFYTPVLSKDNLTTLVEDILAAGAFGKEDTNRMVILDNTGKIKPYLLELHRQMKRRFHKLYKCPILWPVLWLITCFVFLWNNRFLRKTATRDILASGRKRQKLIAQMHLYQK